MILSVSRRTDIPAFYSQWFINRVKQGFVYVRNPFNFHMVSKIPINPDIIDIIVFWSKYPKPLIKKLKYLKDYKYYFLYTITGYGPKIEKYVPPLEETIDVFRNLSFLIGKEKVVWRYDPILFTDFIDLDYHINNFRNIAEKLSGFTTKCIISFVTYYKKTKKNMKDVKYIIPDKSLKLELIKEISKIGKLYNLKIETCSEEQDFNEFGITHGSCINRELVEKITGKKINAKKDRYQRSACGCIESVDIGAYNTCLYNCLYCYANFDRKRVLDNYSLHDVNSPLLYGKISGNDKIYERR